MDDFDVSGIFDDLTPQDFDRDTSARHVSVQEPESFEAFVASCQDAMRFAFHAADGRPCPATIMVGPDGRRIFAPDDDETLGQYLDRLHREAVAHSAHTIFTMWLTQGGTYLATQPGRIDDPSLIAEAEHQNGLQQVIYWYAQYGGAVRHGIMKIEAGDTGDIFESPAENAAPVYRAILG